MSLVVVVLIPPHTPGWRSPQRGQKKIHESPRCCRRIRGNRRSTKPSQAEGKDTIHETILSQLQRGTSRSRTRVHLCCCSVTHSLMKTQGHKRTVVWGLVEKTGNEVDGENGGG